MRHQTPQQPWFSYVYGLLLRILTANTYTYENAPPDADFAGRKRAGRSWIRKAAVVLVPAYSLSVMFDVLEPPGLLVRHALDDIRSEFLGTDSRVFSAAELQALSGGKRPMLRCVC